MGNTWCRQRRSPSSPSSQMVSPCSPAYTSRIQPVSSAISGRQAQLFIHLLSQEHDLLVLLQQHGQQEGLERQGVRGVASRGDVLVSGGEQVVQGDLVRTTQGPPEAGEGGLFLKKFLGDGWKSAAHGSS